MIMRTLFALLYSLTLAFHQPQEGLVEPGQEETLTFAVHAGDSVRITVREKGDGVIVSIDDPDGKRVAGPANPISALPETWLSVVAEQDGMYTLRLRALKNNKAATSYVASIDELRKATEQDRKRYAAERLVHEAEELRANGGGDNLKSALARLQEALPIVEASGDRRFLAETYHLCGLTRDYLGQLKESAECYERAIAIRREDGDARAEGETLANLGPVYRQMDDLVRAQQALERAIELLPGKGDPRSESTAYHNMGTLQFNLGAYQKSLAAYQEAVRIRHAAGMRAPESESLSGVASALRNLGETQKALDLYGQALAVKRELKDQRGQMVVLHNTGVAYSVLGQFEKAIEYYEQSLVVSRHEGDRQWQATALVSRGIAWRFLGQFDKAAQSFREALDLRVALGNKRGQAEVLSNLGLLEEMRGDLEGALSLYERALPLNREMRDPRGEGFTAANLASVHARLGNQVKAAELLAQAADVQRAIADENGLAQTLLIQARVLRDAGKLTEARTAVEEAIARVESLRARIGLPSLRASHRALKEDHYTMQVDVLMQMGNAAEALIASERARARTMRETLAIGNVTKLPGVDAALLTERRTIQQRLNAKERARAAIAGAKDKLERLAVLDREIGQLLEEHEAVEARIRASSPQYASLTQPPNLSLEGLRRQLDDDTSLLVYSLGDPRSYAWVLTRSELHSVSLPAREQIENAARRMHELISAGRKRELETPLRRSIEELSALVVRPLQAHLGTSRVAIVGDGALQYVPFAVLSDAKREALIVRHEIVSLPSASLLEVLRAKDGDGEAQRKAIAVFADPVLEKNDSRVRVGTQVASTAPVPPDLLRSGEQSGGAEFQRLAYTSVEADAIVALATEKQSLKATGFRATRAAVLETDLRQFGIIHFATHGLLNNENPELSGIVLSLVDERGEPQDGFLRVHEICGLDLNAELVVVSACRTALGKEIRGEGLIGITRAFMLGGAERVMASLWDVRDQATAELMKRFYRGMFEKNLRPAAALRAAQLSMRREQRWQSPFYWAPFVVQGDWR